MSITIFCKKLNKNAEKLSEPPYPGEIGQEIQQNISKEAWNLWLEQQTKIINENRLNPIDVETRKLLEKEMLSFLFS